MKLLFKSNNYSFYAQIFNPLAINAVKKILPLEVPVLVLCERICFSIPTTNIAGEEDKNLKIKEGDLFWDIQKKYLCISLCSNSSFINDPVFKGVKIGKILSSIDELQQLKEGVKASISLFEEKNVSGNRILSQEEIDILIKQLLKEK